MKVLILSSQEDPHATSVLKHLEEMSAHVDFFRCEEFIEKCAVSFTLGSNEKLCLLEREEGNLELTSYNSIWHRRAGSLSAGRFVEPWISQMVENEARGAWNGMLRTLPCLWMNHPLSDLACSQKLWQLQLATEVGLTIPETLVTNKPDLVKKFFKQCQGEVVYKLIGEGTSFAFPSNELQAGIPTLPLRQGDLQYIDQVRHAPHLFQRRIKKAYDLRVTIVGKKLFCISIDSQAGRSKVDWRNDYGVDMQTFELPDDVKSKCFALMRRLGLNYGALDFILTDKNEYVFLEINCAGQYLWIEQRTPHQISLAIARLLAGKSKPLVGPSSRSWMASYGPKARQRVAP